jgi:Co/Zn/Cd efflux system component
MHTHSIEPWRHGHVFLGSDHSRNERRTRLVIGLTGAMMVAGIVFGSMALLADGVHMATHAGALAISAMAYLYARRHARDGRFSFGTGKLGDLAGFASAVILALVALLVASESALRLAAPVAIPFSAAIAVAVLGLAVIASLVSNRPDAPDHYKSRFIPAVRFGARRDERVGRSAVRRAEAGAADLSTSFGAARATL